jgi:hypothetical protein
LDGSEERDLLQEEKRPTTEDPGGTGSAVSMALLDGSEEKRPITGQRRKETYYRDILQRVPAAPSAWLFWMAARIWVVMLSTSCSMFLSATCFAKETYHRRKRDLL